ncbi:hypothetical protein D3C81_2052590 [compost metagenome]
MAFEQRQPDIVFQILQPLRQPRLRRIEHRGGMADVAGLGQAEQHLEVAQPQAVGPVHAGPRLGGLSRMYIVIRMDNKIISLSNT